MASFGRRFRFLVLFTLAIGTASFSESPSEGQASREKVREDAEFLVSGVESDYDCKFSLVSLVSAREPIQYQFTVVVRFDGSECEEAYRALHLRTIAFPFRFLELSSIGKPDTKNDHRNDT
jgi:hypothetical protein